MVRNMEVDRRQCCRAHSYSVFSAPWHARVLESAVIPPPITGWGTGYQRLAQTVAPPANHEARKLA